MSGRHHMAFRDQRIDAVAKAVCGADDVRSCTRCRAQVDAALVALAALGYVVVPAIPDLSTLASELGVDTVRQRDGRLLVTPARIDEIFREMLSGADLARRPPGA